MQESGFRTHPTPFDLRLLLPVELGERLARDAERIDTGRDAAVDRHLHEHLADLVAGDAVGQRAGDVQLQLVRPVEALIIARLSMLRVFLSSRSRPQT